jgi:hypothetical protein
MAAALFPAFPRGHAVAVAVVAKPAALALLLDGADQRLRERRGGRGA